MAVRLLFPARPLVRFLGIFSPRGGTLPDTALKIPVERRDGGEARPRGDVLNRLAGRAQEFSERWMR